MPFAHRLESYTGSARKIGNSDLSGCASIKHRGDCGASSSQSN